MEKVAEFYICYNFKCFIKTLVNYASPSLKKLSYCYYCVLVVIGVVETCKNM